MTVQISTNIDPSTMQQFDEVCGTFGVTPSDAIGMLITDAVHHHRISFDEATQPKQAKRTRAEMFDCARGRFNIPDDFNAPLELREYEKPAEKKPKKSRAEMFGCMGGDFDLPDDFDAPLEDFKEYME